jgi:hypothetical protein
VKLGATELGTIVCRDDDSLAWLLFDYGAGLHFPYTRFAFWEGHQWRSRFYIFHISLHGTLEQGVSHELKVNKISRAAPHTTRLSGIAQHSRSTACENLILKQAASIEAVIDHLLLQVCKQVSERTGQDKMVGDMA